MIKVLLVIDRPDWAYDAIAKSLIKYNPDVDLELELYYLRSDSARNAENVNIKIPRINLEDMECLSCEG